MESELLGGLTVLQAEARLAAPGNGWEDRLYRTVYPRQEETQTHVHRNNGCSLLRMGQPRAGCHACLAQEWVTLAAW